MSLKRNILATYIAQIYVTLIGILILPMYLKYMGAEAYGLVGFFTMLQALFNLLDMGLTPTVARETARFRGGATNAVSYRSLLRSLQFIFFILASVGCGVLFHASDWISQNWLNVNELPLERVRTALQLISLAVALRWMSGLYRGCISGSEELVWLGVFNAFIATIRFIGVLPVLMWYGKSVEIFFIYQVAVALIELSGLVIKAYSSFPALSKEHMISWSPISLFLPIADILKFSLSIAFTSSVWVLVTQTDKLVVSKILPLAEYGYFTLAVLAASGVMMIGGPISSALMPRMAKMQVEGSEEKLISLYRVSTQLVAVIAIPAALIISLFAEQLLLTWTGDVVVARQAAPVLRLYALGNAFLAMSAFAYYLQFAYGDLNLHLLGSAIFASVLVPLLLFSTKSYGAVGAGYSWLMVNALYFFLWLPLIHKKFVKELHKKWMLDDLAPIALGSTFSSVVLEKFFAAKNYESSAFLVITFSSTVCLLSAALCSSYARAKLKVFIFKFLK